MTINKDLIEFSRELTASYICARSTYKTTLFKQSDLMFVSQNGMKAINIATGTP